MINLPAGWGMGINISQPYSQNEFDKSRTIYNIILAIITILGKINIIRFYILSLSYLILI